MDIDANFVDQKEKIVDWKQLYNTIKNVFNVVKFWMCRKEKNKKSL